MKKFSKPFFEKRGGFFPTTKNGLVDELDVVHDSPEASEAGGQGGGGNGPHRF